jgi:hypothetical protein
VITWEVGVLVESVTHLMWISIPFRRMVRAKRGVNASAISLSVGFLIVASSTYIQPAVNPSEELSRFASRTAFQLMGPHCEAGEGS